jgi:asparagine synthetase B (glutamine-hydrolysing)
MPWLTPYARRLLRRRPASDPRGAFSRRPDQYDALFGSALALEAPEAFHSSTCSVEVRDPYLDTRLAEFALAIPAHQLFGKGETKHVLRNAMRGLLPPEVVERTEPTGLTALYHRGLLDREAGRVQRLLSRRDGLWRRFVSPDWLSEVFPRKMREVPDGAASLVPWQCVSSQLWIDHLEQGAGHVDLGRSDQARYLVA